MIRVQSVHPESVGADLGIEPGFELHSVDGRELTDFLDWEFHTAEDRFVLLASSPGGELFEYDVERPADHPLGIELEPPRIRRCANRCDFCFVDGLPEGLRDPLYVRDDDYRLSFRYGNFATLTNLKPRDIERILEYRLSPLYVSVHATDPVVRRRLLRHPLAPAIVPQLEEFAAGGIRFHTQIVLQPGVNDGPVLRRSLEDLYGLGEAALSVSVVPVGLTEFSKHDLVREPTAEECRSSIDTVEEFQARALAERDRRWVYGADELYVVAESPLPPAGAYDGFQQVENGVGSVRYLQQQIDRAGTELPNLAGRRIGVFTGRAMEHLMPEVLETLGDATGASFELVPLTNTLLGSSVTCAGLLPGSDFLAALKAGSGLDLALIPAEAVNDNGKFLDDLTLDELEAASPVDIRPSYDFADALAGGEIA
jgi:putative radical SAM enzyme (TIGR03279 family)